MLFDLRKENMEKGEELSKGLIEIANTLENYRLKIYQTKTESWEDDKGYVDDRLFSLQSQIRNVAEIVEYMHFAIEDSQ